MNSRSWQIWDSVPAPSDSCLAPGVQANSITLSEPHALAPTRRWRFYLSFQDCSEITYIQGAWQIPCKCQFLFARDGWQLVDSPSLWGDVHSTFYWFTSGRCLKWRHMVNFLFSDQQSDCSCSIDLPTCSFFRSCPHPWLLLLCQVPYQESMHVNTLLGPHLGILSSSMHALQLCINNPCSVPSERHWCLAFQLCVRKSTDPAFHSGPLQGILTVVLRNDIAPWLQHRLWLLVFTKSQLGYLPPPAFVFLTLEGSWEA